MKFRSNPFPRRFSEFFCYLTVGLLLPLVLLYEVLFVLPAVHQPGGALHAITVLWALYLLYNIEGNLLLCMWVDTSVDFDSIEQSGMRPTEQLGWRHCKTCDRLAPPRSWHCKLCGVCILKRDHHCSFTGYCIGHQNQRYFLCFLLHLFIGSLHSLIYNIYFMFGIHGELFGKLLLEWHLVYMFISAIPLWAKLQFVALNLNIMSIIFPMIALIYYIPKMLRGAVSFEDHKSVEYDQGICKNFKSVLGTRWFLALLFPTVKSPLPVDGYNWKGKPSDV